MPTYQFKLTPLDTIFFGDEKSPFKQEYYQRSRYLPQQTAILGFLRYEALRRAGKLGKDHGEWPKLIGDRSFIGLPNQTFGVIQKVGPVGIWHNGKILHPLRNPVVMTEKPIPAKVCFGDEKADWDSLSLFEFPGQNKRYDPKDHSHFAAVFSDYTGTSVQAECDNDEEFEKINGFKMPKPKTGIFWKDVRPGITKSYKGVSGEEGYYKTEFLRMMPDFAYTFSAEINEYKFKDNHNWKDPAIVKFGGDRSLFRMEVVTHQDDDTGKGEIFVLKSDASVSNSIYDHCRAIISDVRHFRNIRTQSSSKENFYNKRPGIKNNGNAQVLLASGSILIAKNADEAAKLAESLQQNSAFSNIGYNQFKRLTSLPKGIQHDSN